MQDRFNNLSKAVNTCLQNGCCDILWPHWKEMAEIMQSEEKYVDELKVLMLAFYMYLGRHYMVYLPIIEMAKIAVVNARMTLDERFELYSEIAFDTTGRYNSFSCKDSFEVFELCVHDRKSEAYDIIDKVIMSKLTQDNL